MSASAPTGRALALILGLALAVRLCFLFVTPFTDRESRFGILGFNDELAHLNYVRFVAEERALPIQIRSVLDPDAFVHNDFEYFQPPLYYLLAAPLHATFEAVRPGTGGYGARLLSVLFGVLTVAAAYRAGSAFGRRTALLSASLLALFPTHAYFTTLATNDSLAWLFGALLVARLLHSPSEGAGPPETFRLACMLALGLVTKSTLLTLAPLLLVKPLAAAFHRRDAAPLVPPITALLCAFTLASPYYARNLLLYGSLLGMESGHGAPDGLLQDPSWSKAWLGLGFTVMTFWNRINTPLGFEVVWMKAFVVALTALSLGVFLEGWRRNLSRGMALGRNHALVLAACLLAAGGYGAYNLRFLESDARLMFQSLTALAVLTALALDGLWGGRGTEVPDGMEDWSGRQDSNLRLSAPKADALPD
jgi:4-amino-4-deoxy-L-arabinose transferase-like glycosyltransferase